MILAFWIGCLRVLPADVVPTELRTYAAPDGWTGSLRRFAAEGPPVVLVHGLGVNHQNFEVHSSVSLAVWLQAQGFDTWVVSYRADPGCVPPSRRDRYAYDFDAIARNDLVAAVQTVRRATGGRPLGWVGHSLGGILLYAHLRDHPEDVAAGVIVASPATLAEGQPLYALGQRVGFLLKGRRGRLPAAGLARSSLVLGRLNPFLRQVVHPPNVDRRVVRTFVRDGVQPVSRPLAAQLLSWAQAGEILDRAGQSWVRPVQVPLLLLGASVDRVVHPRDVEAGCRVQLNCRYQELSEAEGFSSDYGHGDVLIGRRAQEEVFPLIGDFLRESLGASE